MRRIKLPTGQIKEFPDDMPNEQIEAQVQKEMAGMAAAPKATSEQPAHGFDYRRLDVSEYPRRITKDIMAGLLQAGRQVANIPHKISEKIPGVEPFDYADFLGVTNQTPMDRGFQSLGQILPAFALPAGESVPVLKAGLSAAKNIPKVGGLLGALIGGDVLPFAGYSALQAEKDPGKAFKSSAEIMAALGAATKGAGKIASSLADANPEMIAKIKQAVYPTVGGAVGSILGPVGAATGGALGYAKATLGKGAQKAKQEALTEGVDLMAPHVQERLAAAKRIGIDLTPGEAAGLPALRARAGQTGKTPEAFMQKQELLQARQDQIAKHAEDLFENIYNPEVHQEIQQSLYDIAHSQHIPESVAKELEKNHVIADAMKKVSRLPEALQMLEDAGLTLKEGTQTQGVYWDAVKRMIDKKEQEALKIGDTFTAKDSEARQMLLDAIDPHLPEYPLARAIAQRKKTREKFEKAFDRKDISSVSIAGALKSDKAFEELSHKTRNVPGAKQALDDMRLLYKDLTPAATGREAEKLSTTGMYQDRNTANAMTRLLHDLLSNEATETNLVKMLHSEKWQDQVRELAKMKPSL